MGFWRWLCYDELRYNCLFILLFQAPAVRILGSFKIGGLQLLGPPSCSGDSKWCGPLFWNSALRHPTSLTFRCTVLRETQKRDKNDTVNPAHNGRWIGKALVPFSPEKKKKVENSILPLKRIRRACACRENVRGRPGAPGDRSPKHDTCWKSLAPLADVSKTADSQVSGPQAICFLCAVCFVVVFFSRQTEKKNLPVPCSMLQMISARPPRRTLPTAHTCYTAVFKSTGLTSS